MKLAIPLLLPMTGLVVYFASGMFKERLEVSATSGQAPLIVRIIGPERIAKKSSLSYSKWVGCEFNVDWGDQSIAEPTIGESCEPRLEHIYQAPGSYKIKRSPSYAEPDDSHTTDWKGEATVTVK